MPQLTVGDDAPQFTLPAIDGTTFDMSAMKGKRVILTFFRFSSCPFCNIRINSIVKRWDEFGEDTVCLLYTSPSPRDRQKSRMPSSA